MRKELYKECNFDIYKNYKSPSGNYRCSVDDNLPQFKNKTEGAISYAVKPYTEWFQYKSDTNYVAFEAAKSEPHNLNEKEVAALRAPLCRMAPQETTAKVNAINASYRLGNRRYRFGDFAKRSMQEDVWYSVDAYGVVRVHSWSTAGMAA